MKIKEGYNGKELQIRIGNARKSERSAEVWIEFEEKKIPKETLSYANINELLDLKEEIEKAIKEIVNGK